MPEQTLNPLVSHSDDAAHEHDTVDAHVDGIAWHA